MVLLICGLAAVAAGIGIVVGSKDLPNILGGMATCLVGVGGVAVGIAQLGGGLAQ